MPFNTLLQDFCFVIKEKTREMDTETHFKVILCSTLKILGTVKTKQEDWNQTQDTFRVFSKDDEGCIPADEMKFVLKHLPGKVCAGVVFVYASLNTNNAMLSLRWPTRRLMKWLRLSTRMVTAKSASLNSGEFWVLRQSNNKISIAIVWPKVNTHFSICTPIAYCCKTQ